MAEEMNRLHITAIAITAIGAIPIFRAFHSPLILLAIVLLAVGYVVSASHIGQSAIQTALTIPVYGISTILFGFFAMFQTYKILILVVTWLDSILTDLFNWLSL